MKCWTAGGALLLWGVFTIALAEASTPRTIALLLGDQSELGLASDRTALSADVAAEALRVLSAQPATASLRALVIGPGTPDASQLAALERADLIFVHGLDRPQLGERAPALAAALEQGARTYDLLDEDLSAQRVPGMERDNRLVAYARAGGVENLVAAIEFTLARDFGWPLEITPPRPLPDAGLWHPISGRVFERFEDYARHDAALHPDATQDSWIGLIVPPGTPRRMQSDVARTLMDALHNRGHRLLVAYGWPPEKLTAIFLDDAGHARIDALILGSRGAVDPDTVGPALKALDVPVLNAVGLRHQSLGDWRAARDGLNRGERFDALFWAELAGALAPTVVSARATVAESATGIQRLAEQAVPKRVERLAERAHRWARLRNIANAEKRVALIYYNSPAGADNIEADYLNVPASLWRILQGLGEEGYELGETPNSATELLDAVKTRGLNVSAERPGALAQWVRRGDPVRVPMSTYRRWFGAMPASLRDAVIAEWGEPEQAEAMLWREAGEEPAFVLPILRYGNVLLGAQPVKGWDLSTERAFSDAIQPPQPHHQYLAFYLWLQHEAGVDAIVHVGTHGSVEGLPGRDTGLAEDDASEVMVGDVPQLYPFAVSHLGDAMRARRRGMAAVITHLLPPFAPAQLNAELSLLLQRADDYTLATQRGEIVAAGVLLELDAGAERLGLRQDLGLERIAGAEEVAALRNYLREVERRWTPYGLHTFGVAPPPETLAPTADAILGVTGDSENPARKLALTEALHASGDAEITALINGLSGRYIAGSLGVNPIRNPSVLPTGRMPYDFDASRMPTPGAWQQGRDLAENYLREFFTTNGQYPRRLTFVGLWDSPRSEGIAHAKMLALLGVEPIWDARGVVTGARVIPRSALSHPRVDITMIPAGRSPPELIALIDQAVGLVHALDEHDNPLPIHQRSARNALMEAGVNEQDAERMARVRIFTAPPGSYGTGLDNVVPASNRWQQDGEIAAVYFRRMGHLYGQGYWGDQPGGEDVGTQVLQLALAGSAAVLHTYSGDSVAVLDHSSAYRHLGGAALAIRTVEGRSVPSQILNIEGAHGHVETLERFMGRELRTRYTNPGWVRAMLDEGFAGAAYVNEVTQRLWGFQVVTPEAVDDAKWQEWYETYVADRNQLDIRSRFRAAGNLLAYQALVDRMIVAANTGYWNTDAATLEHLDQVNREVIAEAGVACDADSCSSPEIVALAEALDREAADAAGGYGLDALGRVPVRGQQLREVAQPVAGAASSPLTLLHVWLLAGVVAAGALYQYLQTRREIPR